jgi:hypothetical protein
MPGARTLDRLGLQDRNRHDVLGLQDRNRHDVKVYRFQPVRCHIVPVAAGLGGTTRSTRAP